MADAADPLTLFAEEEERAQQEASEAAQKKQEEERNKQKERSGSFFNPFDDDDDEDKDGGKGVGAVVEGSRHNLPSGQSGPSALSLPIASPPISPAVGPVSAGGGAPPTPPSVTKYTSPDAARGAHAVPESVTGMSRNESVANTSARSADIIAANE